MVTNGQASSKPERIRTGRWKSKEVRYRAGRIIVKLRPPAEETSEAVQSACRRVADAIPDGAMLRRPGKRGRVLYAVAENEDVVAVARKITRLDEVEYAEPDVVDHACIVPSDTRYGDQWGLQKIGMPGAWDLQTGGSGVLIGIIDSGISMSGAGALDHPDLNDTSRYVLGTDFVDGGTPRDLNGHGTHVAGIAAAESNNAQGVAGMNWASTVYVCRTLDTAGNGSSADFADAVEEIVDYALAHNLKAVINYSAGGADNQTKRDACQYVNDNGMILCAATGNDNAGPVIFPAAYSVDFDGVIAVGSTDSNDTVSSFSNVGPEVTVVAPGRNILSTMPTYAVTIAAALNYDELDGTSMATPCVTGLVALMWSRHPSFTNKKIRDCLTGTAVKLGSGSFDNTWGNGRVAAEAALRCGDVVFPPFTTFTRFTIFTAFTRLTPFTRFTRFTLFTRLTRFTRFTVFTRFTPFTAFTAFTRFPPIRPGPEIEVVPFVRVGRTVFDPRELELRRTAEFQGVAGSLEQVGIRGLHELAASDAAQLARRLGMPSQQGRKMVDAAKAVLETMVAGKGRGRG
jgi:subtilisin family serine protease